MFLRARATALIVSGFLLYTSPLNAQVDSFASLMQLGDKAADNQKLDRAIAFYTQASKLSPSNWTAHAKRARLLIAENRVKEASASVDRWVALHPDAWAWHSHGVEMQEAGEFKKALADFDRSCNLIRYSGGPFLRRAIVRLMTGNYSGARSDSYVALDFAPTYTSAYQLCSISDAFCGSPSKSISFVNKYSFAKRHKGSELQSASPSPSSKYVENPNEMTRADAEVLFKNLKKNPPSLGSAQLSFAKAIVYFYQQDYESALKQLGEKNSGELSSRLLKFYCFISRGELDRAGKEVHRLVQEYPTSDYVLDALDAYCFERGTRQAGISEMKNLISQSSKNSAAPYELAKVYKNLDDIGEALKYCEVALRLRPMNEELLLIKATLLLTSARESEALSVLADILARNKNCGQAYMMRATIFSHQENWNKAIENLTKSIDLRYNVIKALPARSACYAANHQNALAKKDAEELKDVDRTEWRTRMY